MTLARIVSALAVAAICNFTLLTPATAAELQDIQAQIKQGNLSQALDKANAYLTGHPKDAQVRFLKGVILTVPMALICGSTLPCRISRITTGTVLFNPDTNHAAARSTTVCRRGRCEPSTCSWCSTWR